MSQYIGVQLRFAKFVLESLETVLRPLELHYFSLGLETFEIVLRLVGFVIDDSFVFR